MVVDVIIPAYNEEGAIGDVVRALPRSHVRDVIVCDNDSTDATAERAAEAGALVVPAPGRGYGNACLVGLDYIRQRATPVDAYVESKPLPDVVAFVDGDGSDYPEQLPLLLAPIRLQSADLVIGSRALGQRERGAMQPHQIFGNWLATTLIRWFWQENFTDLGPFRALTWSALERIDMQDRDFGWTVEMQVKAAKLKLHCVEVPVNYRRRAHGVSKVSGSLRNSFRAGDKILRTIFANR